MKKVLLLILLMPFVAHSQIVVGTLIGRIDSFENNGHHYRLGDTVAYNEKMYKIRSIEKRRYKNDTLTMAVFKGGSFMPLDSISSLHLRQLLDKETEEDFYQASNGITYHIGDTIILGRGSEPNGDFKYLTIGGWAMIAMFDSHKKSDQFDVGRILSGMPVIIRKIRLQRMKGVKKAYFVVGGGNITNYYLWIDDAIETCEIKACKNGGETIIQQPLSTADEILKFKKLLDNGIISQQEFDEQKKKLLSK